MYIKPKLCWDHMLGDILIELTKIFLAILSLALTFPSHPAAFPTVAYKRMKCFHDITKKAQTLSSAQTTINNGNEQRTLMENYVFGIV